jgi:hypothetical protein
VDRRRGVMLMPASLDHYRDGRWPDEMAAPSSSGRQTRRAKSYRDRNQKHHIELSAGV